MKTFLMRIRLFRPRISLYSRVEKSADRRNMGKHEGDKKKDKPFTPPPVTPSQGDKKPGGGQHGGGKK
jgi:hypothetical protein